jgi:hypothetical protein
LVLAIRRIAPAAKITMPTSVNIPGNWLMSPGGGLVELNAISAPMMMSVNPSSFSIIINIMGLSSVMPEPSRFYVTVPRLILIYLSYRIKIWVVSGKHAHRKGILLDRRINSQIRRLAIF